MVSLIFSFTCFHLFSRNVFYWCSITKFILTFLQQLTDSLLEMEEEKAIWSAKEKASIEAIEEKAKLYNAECASLLKGMLKV